MTPAGMAATPVPTTATATGSGERLARHGNHANRNEARSRADHSQSAASGADIDVLSHDRLSCQCRGLPAGPFRVGRSDLMEDN
jgi:hypothetical protein